MPTDNIFARRTSGKARHSKLSRENYLNLFVGGPIIGGFTGTNVVAPPLDARKMRAFFNLVDLLGRIKCLFVNEQKHWYI